MAPTQLTSPRIGDLRLERWRTGVPIGATFDLNFASWQDTSTGNDAFPTPTGGGGGKRPCQSLALLTLLGAGLVALGIIRRRRRPTVV